MLCGFKDEGCIGFLVDSLKIGYFHLVALPTQSINIFIFIKQDGGSRVGSHVVFAWIHCTDVRIHCTDIPVECR